MKTYDYLASSRRQLSPFSLLVAIASLSVPALAMAGAVTYTNPACTSFVVSGTPPNQTVTCVTAGATPVCAPIANPPSPPISTSTTISANCSNGPLANGYVWTGGTCAGLTGSTCTVSKSRRTSVLYSVSGSNASGSGAAAQITITWQ